MQQLLMASEFREALVEDSDELESQERLNAGQDHAGLIGRVCRLVLQRLSVNVFHVSSLALIQDRSQAGVDALSASFTRGGIAATQSMSEDVASLMQ
jgi:hypothetical protein